MLEPSNLVLINDIENITSLKIYPVLATQEDISKLNKKIYATDIEKEEIFAELDSHLPESEDEMGDLSEAVKKAPIVKLANMIISRAVKLNASDIHLEPQSTGLRVRYRIDGVLMSEMMVPESSKTALVSRFKIIAELDITEQRIPQDGRIERKINNNRIDMRISTLPTVFGEKVVIRLLIKKRRLLDIDQIGFNQVNLKIYKKLK